MASAAESTDALTEIKGESVKQKPADTQENGKESFDSKQQQRTIDILDGAQSLISVVVLALCCLVSFSSRLFAVIRFESIIHEFDPWLVRKIMKSLENNWIAIFILITTTYMGNQYNLFKV